MKIQGLVVILSAPSIDDKKCTIKFLQLIEKYSYASGSWNFYTIITRICHFLVRPMYIEFVFKIVYWWSMHHLCWQTKQRDKLLKMQLMQLMWCDGRWWACCRRCHAWPYFLQTAASDAQRLLPSFLTWGGCSGTRLTCSASMCLSSSILQLKKTTAASHVAVPLKYVVAEPVQRSPPHLPVEGAHVCSGASC